jgi:hypothetical protein
MENKKEEFYIGQRVIHNMYINTYYHKHKRMMYGKITRISDRYIHIKYDDNLECESLHCNIIPAP